MEKARQESLRKAYGETLVELGRENKDIVVLEADLGKSTMSALFKEKFPERYFEMGIAEQNMASVSAGLALAGKIPFYSTFAVFASGRAYDQIRCSIAIPKANVKICGSSCGLSDFGDGKTHQSVEDANIVRAIPNMTVLNPCDAGETKKMVRAMALYRGPVYIRINRNDLPVYTAEDEKFEIGKIYPVLDSGAGQAEVCIFATGVMVSKSVEAAEVLKKSGIGVQVLNVSTLKPLLKKEILKYAGGKRVIVTAEEAVKTGGLGNTIAAILAEETALPGEIPASFVQIAIEDTFGASAHGYEELLEEYGLNTNSICNAVKKALR
ncbi:MAG: transketolase family protein [Treponema sp.]|jgi:transketolase|nr:transketolase family protein [Treponema sp.]